MTEKELPTSSDSDVSNRVSLKRIAKAIDRKQPQRSESANERLLKHLRSGRLRAGFYCPGGQPVWITISSEYWQSFSMKEWKKIIFKPKTNPSWNGLVTVPMRDFSCEFATARTARFGSQPHGQSVAQVLNEFLALAKKRFEVEVLETNWIKFAELERIRDEDPTIVRSSKSKNGKQGTKEHPGWSKIAPIMAAYFAAGRSMQGGRKKANGKITQEILEAVAGQYPGQPLPAPGTFIRTVGETIEFVRLFEE